MNNAVNQVLQAWAELPIIPEGMPYPVLDRSGGRIVDAGGTVGQPTFGAEVERALADGMSLIRVAFEVIEFNPFLMGLVDEEQEDLPEGLDDRPRHKVRLYVQFGLEPPRRVIKTGVIGWQRQHVVAYMNEGKRWDGGYTDKAGAVLPDLRCQDGVAQAAPPCKDTI